MQVFEYDKDLAAQLTDEAGQQELQDIYNSNYSNNASTGEVDTTYNTIVDGGRGFNEFLINYQEVYYNFNETTGQVDTTYGANRRYNPRQNSYFKPIVTLRDVWSLSDRSSLTTTAYASFGTGGGEALLSTSGHRGATTTPWTSKGFGMLTNCLNSRLTVSTSMKTEKGRAQTSFEFHTMITVGLAHCQTSSHR